ncbi:hypothetical protein PSP20601_05490 [Pandoraea sputorum]|nr:hypothetical protein PSP20601_05490 [Pandoraea sputorum]
MSIERVNSLWSPTSLADAAPRLDKKTGFAAPNAQELAEASQKMGELYFPANPANRGQLELHMDGSRTLATRSAPSMARATMLAPGC